MRDGLEIFNWCIVNLIRLSWVAPFQILPCISFGKAPVRCSFGSAALLDRCIASFYVAKRTALEPGKSNCFYLYTYLEETCFCKFPVD
jgi:hypothetical protein